MLNLCIPTLNRYDRLYNCVDSALNGSLVPEMIYIIDNGKQITQRIRDRVGDKLFLYTPETNLGVARSWNWFFNVVPHPMLITNDDVEFGTYDLENFSKAYLLEDTDLLFTNNVSHLNMFSCFMPTPNLILRVGLFDEGFYPAYFEDNDYFYRMRLAGMGWKAIPTDILHYSSSTLEMYTPEQKEAHHGQFNANHSYFRQKWGGSPGYETYTTPFGQE